MQEMLCRGLTALFLLLCTWQDIRMARISGRLICLFGLAGILVRVICKSPMQTWIFCILPGVGILAFGRLTGEQIGYGDGLVMVVAGLFLKAAGVISLFLSGLVLCAVSAAVLFLTGKVTTRTAFPFLPFLLAGFVLQTVISYT